MSGIAIARHEAVLAVERAKAAYKDIDRITDRCDSSMADLRCELKRLSPENRRLAKRAIRVARAIHPMQQQVQLLIDTAEVATLALTQTTDTTVARYLVGVAVNAAVRAELIQSIAFEHRERMGNICSNIVWYD